MQRLFPFIVLNQRRILNRNRAAKLFPKATEFDTNLYSLNVHIFRGSDAFYLSHAEGRVSLQLGLYDDQEHRT